MNMYTVVVSTLGFFAFLQPALAAYGAPGTVQSQIYHASCGYYSTTLADLNIKYTRTLEPGARVFLKYSTIGTRSGTNSDNNYVEIPFAWENVIEVPMHAIGPSIREVNIRESLDSRGSNYHVTKLGFVFHVVMPNGEYFDNGFESDWGSYEVDLRANPISCWNSNDMQNEPQSIYLPITIHNKGYLY